MKIIFDVMHLYYFAHYSPIIKLLSEKTEALDSGLHNKTIEIGILFHQQPNALILSELAQFPNVNIHLVSELQDKTVLAFYLLHKANWVIFGNAFPQADKLNQVSKTALIQHGIGPKSIYYTVSKGPIEYRFVESEYRCKKLQQMFPEKTFITTGYSKLDPIINKDSYSTIDLEELGLSKDKPTLLYAPTFYPSTIENFPKNWPSDFSNFNIIIKPHFFSYGKSRYQKQRDLFATWSKFPNVYLAPLDSQSLLPFMEISDILLSEASSAMFEFAALDKPIIICDFIRLRWSYRGLLSFRYKKRIDQDFEKYKAIGSIAQNYAALNDLISANIQQPSLYQSQREQFTHELVGSVDGKSSVRIVSYLMENA